MKHPVQWDTFTFASLTFTIVSRWSYAVNWMMCTRIQGAQKKRFNIWDTLYNETPLHLHLTFTIVSSSAELSWPSAGTLGHSEGELLDLFLRLTCVLILIMEDALPGARILLLEVFNDNTAGVLYVAFNRGLTWLKKT